MRLKGCEYYFNKRGMFKKETVIDGKGHIMGRLASHVAKQLLSGHRIIVVRCERLMMSGSYQKNKLKFREYMHKTMLTNPKRSHRHYRSPSRIFFKAVRGMLPRKTDRAEQAMGRLKVFEGIPNPYDKKKRMVVTDALKLLKVKSYRPFCELRELCVRVGWKHDGVVERLEAKRVQRAKKYHESKVATQKLHDQKAKLQASASIKEINEKLAKFGY